MTLEEQRENYESYMNLWIEVIKITIQDLRKGYGVDYEEAKDFIDSDLFSDIIELLGLEKSKILQLI